MHCVSLINYHVVVIVSLFGQHYISSNKIREDNFGANKAVSRVSGANLKPSLANSVKNRCEVKAKIPYFTPMSVRCLSMLVHHHNLTLINI